MRQAVRGELGGQAASGGRGGHRASVNKPPVHRVLHIRVSMHRIDNLDIGTLCQPGERPKGNGG